MQLLTPLAASQYRAPKSEPATFFLADGGSLAVSASEQSTAGSLFPLGALPCAALNDYDDTFGGLRHYNKTRPPPRPGVRRGGELKHLVSA